MNLDTLFNISYGLYVVGSKRGEKINAQLANTVFQVTAKPITIAISISKKNLTFIINFRKFTWNDSYSSLWKYIISKEDTCWV